MKFSKVKQFLSHRKTVRIGTCILAAILAAGGIGGYCAYARKETNPQVSAEKETGTKKADTEDLLSEVLKTQAGTENADVEKEETVYVVANPNGEEKEVIVSDWLKNRGRLDVLEDVSDLTDIENVKGEETFQQSEDHKLIWQADGKDIYYQGKTSRALPVEVKLTYYLDGREISPEELAGKSGKVKIRMDYINKEKAADPNVYVPFACISGMVLSDSFTNIEVTNGKVLDDGSKSMVVGFAFPGLADSLDVQESDFDGELKIPDYLEVSADVEDFSLEMTMTLVMSDILQELDVDKELDLSAIGDAVDELDNASEKLVDGGEELSGGASDLKKGVDDYTDGVSALKKGINAYTKGVSKVKKGVNDYTKGVSQVAAGTQSLEKSSGTLKGGIQSLAQGMEQVQGAFEGSSGLVSGSKAIADGIGKLDQELNKGLTESDQKQAQEAVDKMFAEDGKTYQGIKKQASGQYESALKESTELHKGVSDGVSQAMYQAYYTSYMQLQKDSGMSEKQMEAGAKQFAETMVGRSSDSISDVSRQLVSGVAEGSSNLVGTSVADACKDAALSGVESGISTAKSAVASQIEANGDKSLMAGAQTLSSGISKLYQEGVKPLSEGINTLNGNVPGLMQGIRSLNSGASKLDHKSKDLNQGVKTLAHKGGDLNSGASKLDGNSSKLTDGAAQLTEGAKKLSDGILTFDKDGIQKLSDAYHGDVEKLTDRIDEVLRAGKNYNTFSGLKDHMSGSVKFIIRTEEIEK